MPIDTLRVVTNPPAPRFRRGDTLRPIPLKKTGQTRFQHNGKFVSADAYRSLKRQERALSRKAKPGKRKKPAKRKATRRPAKRAAARGPVQTAPRRPARARKAPTVRRVTPSSVRRNPDDQQAFDFGGDPMAQKGGKHSAKTKAKISRALKRYHKDKTTAKERRHSGKKAKATFTGPEGKKYVAKKTKRRKGQKYTGYSVVRVNSLGAQASHAVKGVVPVYGYKLGLNVVANAVQKHLIGAPGVNGLLKGKTSTSTMAKMAPFFSPLLYLLGLIVAPKLSKSTTTVAKLQLGAGIGMMDSLVGALSTKLPSTMQPYVSVGGYVNQYGQPLAGYVDQNGQPVAPQPQLGDAPAQTTYLPPQEEPQADPAFADEAFEERPRRHHRAPAWSRRRRAQA